MNRIDIIIPCLNEEDAVHPFMETFIKTCADLTTDVTYTILVIDDGSSDGTVAAWKGMNSCHERISIRILSLSRNFGKEAALSAGFDHAMGDAVIPIDIDLQQPPSLIPQMIDLWRAGNKVVVPQRCQRKHDPWIKKCTASAFYYIFNLISDMKIIPHAGDFRLMDADVVRAIRSMPERERFVKGICAWVGFKTVTIPFEYGERSAGVSKFNGRKLMRLAMDGLTSFTISPLRIGLYAGAMGALISAMYGVFIIARTVIWGVDTPGYASLFVAICFFGSLHAFLIAVVGEYIGRTYIESKQRPLYIIASDSEPPTAK
jgi:glycosyltransferase involved in cell wall biosynthesis